MPSNNAAYLAVFEHKIIPRTGLLGRRFHAGITERPPKGWRPFARKRQFAWGDIRRKLSNRYRLSCRLRPLELRALFAQDLIDCASLASRGAVVRGSASVVCLLPCIHCSFLSLRATLNGPFGLVARGAPGEDGSHRLGHPRRGGALRMRGDGRTVDSCGNA